MPPKTALAAQKSLASKRKQITELKQQLRNEVCTQENGYPGRPTDYAYVQSCRSKRSAGARSIKPPRSMDVTAIKKEINILKKAIQQQYTPDYIEHETPGVYLSVATTIFTLMIAAEQRRKHPDPLDRYDHIIREFAPKLRNFQPRSVPRFTILSLVLRNLQEM